MRKCIDMGEGRKIIISDKDTLKPDGTLEIPDIGLGEAYLGKASYVVYDEEDCPVHHNIVYLDGVTYRFSF